jgi:hypothetical protein
MAEISIRKDGEAYDWLIQHGYARKGPVGSPIHALAHAMAQAVALTRTRNVSYEEITHSMSAVEIE